MKRLEVCVGSFVIQRVLIVTAAMLLAVWCHTCGAAGIYTPADESSSSQSQVITDSGESTDETIESAAEQQARDANERFLRLLQKQPRPGVAFDRVYSFYLDHGTLDQFLSELRSSFETGEDAGVASLIVGLIEAKRGNHLAAEQAFLSAEQHRPQDAVASWLLGQSLLALQKPDAAAAAFERAIERDPQKADLLLIYQDLGRAYRRSRQTEKADAVWNRMESQFPNDLRVKEQIATTLHEEGDLEAALTRYEQLATLHRDLYQKTQYAITAADLKLQLGRRDDALHDFETQLQTLDPESWLARDIRRRIDQSFLRHHDQAGLVSYYQTWLQNHPDDLEIMASLARALMLQGRGVDALDWYRKAIEKAPSNVPLRKEMLSLLTREKLFDEAAAGYEQLQQLDPENIQHLEAWGLLALYRDDQPLSDRRANAITIWKSMLQDRSDDPGTLVQVAELIRRTEQHEEVLSLYRRAVDVRPLDPQYREYLGDYLQTLGRTDEAIQVWQAIAEGDQRTTPNLIRLAEIFRAAGLQDESIAAMQAACELTPEFSDHLKLARWLREYERGGQYPKAVEALKQLDTAESLAESDDERRLLLAERIQTLVVAEQLDEAIRDLTLQLQKTENAADRGNSAEQSNRIAAEWAKLAAYFEAAKRLSDASQAAKKATTLAPESASAWTVAARLYEQSGRYAEAVDAYQELMSLDPRGRTKHLQSITILYQRLGRRDEAVQAGKDLLAAGPENPEFIKFYADLCFHFGERQEALKTLRRSVRSSGADGGLILTLARTLANQNEIDEATSLCWTAFDKSANIEDKSSAVMMLAEFALRANRFDQLVEKLEQHGRVSGQERDAAQCLATAYRVAGDLRSARQALETLLTADHRDAQLLLQLSRLAEEEGDLEAAADYQRRANSILRSDEGETRLANLLVRLGDLSEAEALWNRLAADSTRPAEGIAAIDQLIALESIDSAREICDRILAQSADNWEVLVRRGLLEWRYGQHEKADEFFQRVLDLDLHSNVPAAAVVESVHRRDAGSTTRSDRLPALERLEAVSELAEAFREKTSSSWFGPSSPPAVPQDYGAARLVALIGRYLAARETRSDAAFLEQVQIDAGGGSLRAACDHLGLELFIAERSADNLFTQSDFVRFFHAADAGDIEAQAIYLELIARRISVWVEGNELQSSLDDQDTHFISEEEFTLLLKSLKAVLAEKPQWLITFDAPRLNWICRHQQHLDDLDSLIVEFTRPNTPAPTLAMGLDLELLRGTTDVESVLNRLTLLSNTDRSGNTSDYIANDSEAGEVFEDLTERLLKIARLKRSENGAIPALQVLDWWLRWRHDQVGGNVNVADPVAEQEAARRVIRSVVRSEEPSTSGFVDAGDQDAFDIAAQLGVKNHLTVAECEFLTQVLVLLHQQNLEPQWTDWCNKRLQSTAVNEHLETELLQALFWNLVENREQVLLHLVRAADYAHDDDLLKLALALRLVELNMKGEALDLLGQLSDADPLMLKCREFKVCELAMELSQPEKVKAALTRLAGLQLDDAEHAFVVRELGRIGLEDLRHQLEARRTSVAIATVDTSPLALLDHYEQQGDVTAAVQVAQQLLRRSHKNPTPWRNTTRPTPEQIYARAYKVLKETGELEKMIERQKAQLAKSPHSGRLRKTLLDYLDAAGRVAEADELRAGGQRNQPGLSAQVMIAQAEELIAAKQPQMACDKLLSVIHEYPAEFWRETRNEQIFGVFTEANRVMELADAVLLVDRGRSQSCAPTETLKELIKLLLKNPETHARAADMIQRYSEMYPAYTVSFLKLVEQLPLWSSSDDLFALLTRMYVPSTAEQLQRPQLAWPMDYEYRRVQLGFDQTAAPRGGNLKRLWDALKFSDVRRAELEQTARDAMARLPDWPAGPVIQIVCALSVPENELDEDRIEALVNEMCVDAKPVIPEAVAYNLTQLLRQRGTRMKRAAVKLLETSLQAVPEKQLEIGLPAGRALLELYAELSEPKRGLELLQKSVLESPTMVLDDQDCDRREYSSRLSAGHFFSLFGRPVASLQVLQGLTAEQDAELGAFGELERSQAIAIKGITADNMIAELRLTAAVEDEQTVTALDLQTSFIAEPRQSNRQPVCALMTALCDNRKTDPAEVQELSGELVSSLMRKHPDLSLIVLGTVIVLQSNDKDSIDKVLSAWKEYVDRGGRTEKLPNESSGDFRRRQNALISLAALDSISSLTEPSVTSMTRLSEQSLACVRLQGNRDLAITILNQLQRLYKARGDQLAVERIQRELQSEQDSATGPPQPNNPGTETDHAQLAEQLKAELRRSLLKPQP